MIRNYFNDILRAWDEFWFIPRSARTLSLMRLLVGSMLVYTHLVWTFDLSAFFGSHNAAIPTEYRQLFPFSTSFSWSHFDWLESPGWMWGSHGLALAIYCCFTCGFLTRVTAWLSFAMVVSYANRATGALFGLDQISAFLTLYLALADSGSFYSIDRLIWTRKGQGTNNENVLNCIATRLIQLHLCVVYLFAGLGKLQGTTWWNGQAIWGTLASYEYQTLDMTWLAHHMWLVNLMTYTAIAWEISYPFLVWPKLSRPIFLALALVVHLGIGISMGMMTFGLIMIYANLAFIEPDWITNRFDNEK